MPRCPVCESTRVVIVVSPRRPAFCTGCGARWTQRGSEQRAVHRLDPSPVNISAVAVHPSRPLRVLARGGTT
jgi:Zn-finger nucleic acid-binding protein